MGSWAVRITVVLVLLVGGLVQSADSTGEPLPIAGSLESRLIQVADEVAARGSASGVQLADELGVPVATGRVRVVFEPAGSNTAEARTAVEAVGGTVEAEAVGLVQALVPGRALRALPGLAGGAVVRAPLTPQPAAITGEGVAFTKADVWHQAGFNGSGTDVAVIDLGFAGLAARQAEGEVASPVLVDRCPGRWESTDHGVAVAEVVQEVAPGARLHLICVGTEIELAQALDYVAANGITIVNHSVLWFASSRGDGQGPPGTPEHTVARARAAGILWVNAAGNASEKHWSGEFTDADADGRHEFAPGDERNRVTLNTGRLFCPSLKWDEWPATDEDFDLYVRSVPGDLELARSTTVQDGSQMPREAVCWQNNTPAPVDVSAEIRRARGAGSPRLDLFSTLSGSLKHKVPEGSIVEPATSPAALAVGAVCWETGELEFYSSRGPTIDGRVKPDLVAAATVSGATYGRYQGCQETPTPVAFRGTSASAPHVAAAAALLKQARPELGPDGLIAALLADTTDLGASGPDSLYGAGSFALRPLVPVVTTAPASFGVRYATVSGSVDTRGLTTSYVIEYGPTGIELRSPPQSLLPAAGPTPLSVTLEGLAPGASFRYRILATNAFGSTPGALVSASTLTPSAPGLSATLDVGERTATITATVDPRGDSTTLLAEYGTSTGYGSRIGPIDVGRGVGPRTISVALTGLEPGSSYHFRLVAANPAGTTATPDATLTTRTPPPPPPPDLALSLTASAQVVIAGGEVTYRAVVANHGGSVATGVRLALVLPQASTIQQSSADHGPCRAQAESLTCELGLLLPGETATVVAETRPAGGEATAEVTLDQRDASTNDNRASLRISVGPVAVAAATVPALRLTSVQPPRGALRRGRREITTGFVLNRRARVTMTLLDTTGRRVALLAGSSIGGLRSTKTSKALERSLPAGRSVAILRHRALSLSKPLQVKLVARDSTGKRITLLLTVRR